MRNKEYENVFSLISMFDSEEKVSDFFSFFCQNVIRECKRIDGDKQLKYYPVIYSEKHKTLSVSFDFFVSCISKLYDPGNNQVEQIIMSELRLSSTSKKEELYKLHKNRTFIIINILQDFYNIIHPNNRTINTTYLRGNVSVKDSYFIPMVYEDNDKKPIQYDVIPMKTEKLIDLKVESFLVDNVVELGIKNGLSDVAFNQRAVNKYWEESNYSKRIKYQ